jgi:hypothetical protein
VEIRNHYFTTLDNTRRENKTSLLSHNLKQERYNKH